MKWRAEGASLLSRGAAVECSPGRKPGVNSNPGSEPQRGERLESIRGILRPCGAGTSTLFHPRACARVYILTPLRGWETIKGPAWCWDSSTRESPYTYSLARP